MRSRSAALVVGAAAVLGGLTGAYVLPAGGWSVATPPVPTSSTPGDEPTSSTPTPTHSPSASPSSSPSPTPTAAPTKKLTEADLLSVQSFADQSVTVTYYSAKGSTNPVSAVSACVDDDAHRSRSTLKEITGHDPALEGSWTDPATTDTADQDVAVADSTEDAVRAVDALVAAQVDCQQAAKGNWVYGPVRTNDTSSAVSSSWLGYFPGKDNTDGRAPDDVEPCGGLLFARNGARFSIVHVYLCLDGAQLRGLADAAATRLG